LRGYAVILSFDNFFTFLDKGRTVAKNVMDD